VVEESVVVGVAVFGRNDDVVGILTSESLSSSLSSSLYLYMRQVMIEETDSPTDDSMVVENSTGMTIQILLPNKFFFDMIFLLLILQTDD
jgi:hypothetical protein